MNEPPHHYQDNRPCVACDTDASVGCLATPPIELSDVDFARLSREMRNPSPPTPALVALFRGAR